MVDHDPTRTSSAMICKTVTKIHKTTVSRFRDYSYIFVQHTYAFAPCHLGVSGCPIPLFSARQMSSFVTSLLTLTHDEPHNVRPPVVMSRLKLSKPKTHERPGNFPVVSGNDINQSRHPAIIYLRNQVCACWGKGGVVREVDGGVTTWVFPPSAESRSMAKPGHETSETSHSCLGFCLVSVTTHPFIHSFCFAFHPVSRHQGIRPWCDMQGPKQAETQTQPA